MSKELVFMKRYTLYEQKRGVVIMSKKTSKRDDFGTETVDLVPFSAVEKSKNLTIHEMRKKDNRRYLRKNEVLAKLMDMEAGKKRTFCMTLWMTGLRVTECVNIKKKDIDFKNYTITARWQKNRNWKERLVPLHPQLAFSLQEYTATLNQEDKLFDFSRQYGYQVVKESMGVSPHKMRHSFAMHFIHSSDDPYKWLALQKLLGHKDLRTTMEYMRIAPEDTQKSLFKVSFT